MTASRPAETSVGLPALIPRSVLFGNPERASPHISADGRLLAYLAPSEGVLSIWVRALDGGGDRVVASDPARPIRSVFWQSDNAHVLYLQDREGDENFHLFRVSIDGGEAPRDLTPGKGVRAQVEFVDPRANTIVLSTNERDERLFDAYRLDLDTGHRTIAARNPGNVVGWLSDNELRVRAAFAQNADGSSYLLVRDDEESEWRTLQSFGADDGFNAPVAFSADGTALYVTDAKDANAARLRRYELAGAEFQDVVADGIYDVADVFVDPASREPVAAAILRERLSWTAIDPRFDADLQALREVCEGDFQIANASADGRVWIVAFDRDDGPVSYYAYDRERAQATLLFVSHEALLDYQLARIEPIEFAARDGLALHGYLALPAGLEPRALPTVLFVHGGPWARDQWGYNSRVQWLANRGYAVLTVNFRGSTGYGKAFLNAGDREWAGSMRTDLLDARAWAVSEGFSDPERFAIMGGSYGGYATLAALTFTPRAFTCGVDIVGPSNLMTLLESIPPYWEPMRVQFLRRMGEDPDFLKTQSPLFKADRIEVPLLIAQGANDPRVKQQESDQIVAAMRAHGLPVQYLVFEDEGHGFARPENNRRFFAAAEAFLARYLGGRVEPSQAGEGIDAHLR